jgi:hypothetical protein
MGPPESPRQESSPWTPNEILQQSLGLLGRFERGSASFFQRQ